MSAGEAAGAHVWRAFSIHACNSSVHVGRQVYLFFGSLVKIFAEHSMFPTAFVAVHLLCHACRFRNHDSQDSGKT